MQSILRPINLLLTLVLLGFSLCLQGQENSSLLCADGFDNDSDGLIDCDDPDCQMLSNDGCLTCFEDGSSFADVVIEYSPFCNQATLLHTDPLKSLGVADFSTSNLDEGYVTLGEGGYIKLGFTDNILVNSGDSDADIWIFEVGPAVESSEIQLRPANDSTKQKLIAAGLLDLDMDGYYVVDTIKGATRSVDIDNFVPGHAAGMLKFDAILITDEQNGNCTNQYDGADIDAVCALSSIPEEICNNGIDDNNNGQIDEGCEFENCDFNNEIDEIAHVEGNLCVEGEIHLGDVLKLQPRNSAPENPGIGSMYFDNTIFKLRVWDGTTWQNCW